MSALDNTTFTLDKQRLRRAFDRAAERYDQVAVLQREIEDRMLQRLDIIRVQPDVVLDVGAGTGRGTEALARRYRRAQVVALDLAPAMLRQARQRPSLWRRWQRRQHYLCGDAEGLPVAADSVDLIFSNLTLQWCTDPDRTFQEFQRVLRPGGVVLFSSLGPDTLHELRASWAQVDPYNHTNAFLDMHDIGDAMVRAGLADPVMETEQMTLTYRDLRQLMRDLKALGAHNATAGRARSLTGKGRLAAVTQAYEAYRRDGLLPASYEVVYGHAWGTEQSVNTRHADGAVGIPLHQLGGRRQA